MQELTSTEVKTLIKKAGFKSKAEFAREMGMLPATVNNWGCSNPPPLWFHKAIEWARVYNEVKRQDLINERLKRQKKRANLS